MFSEKNFPKLIIATPIITVLFFAILIIYFFVSSQYKNFHEESIEFENEYLKRQKNILRSENEKVHKYIALQREIYEKEVKKELKDSTLEARKLLKHLSNYKMESILLSKTLKLLPSSSFKSSYFLINTQKEIYHLENQDFTKEEITSIVEIAKIVSAKEEGSYISVASKQIYLSPPLKQGFILGSFISKEIIQAKLKQQVITWAEKIRYGQNGYIWIHDTTHHLIAHPFRQESIGKDDTYNTDSTGAKIFQKFIQTALTNEHGGFLEYYWAKPEFGAPRKKIGFLKLDKTWGWAIGTGLYIDDIESFIKKKKLLLEEKIDKYINIILLLTAYSIIAVGIVSYLISKNIIRVFESYRFKVKRKEEALKNFNKELSFKVKEAIREAKEKDKALMHQSKLAQMGEMINMIAHQWRQPLCEISCIFMELQTASKFKKLEENFVVQEVKEANRLIDYMSKTIDDFRNFFKPDKKKENFSVATACKEALSLAHASLKNNQIKISLYIEKDLFISGYPSEYAQVVLNLILNAKDALIERKVNNPQIEIIVDVVKNFSLVSVSDNAGGVEEQYLQRVFEPYFSTKSTNGTGLGLYMSKMIIEDNMHGTLLVKNGKDGAVFVIRIEEDAR